MNRLVGAATAVCILLMSSPVLATCGSANCFLVTGTSEGVSQEGKLTFDISYRYIPQDKKLEGTHSVNVVLTPKIDFENGVIIPNHHSEVKTQNTLVELDMAWGLSARLTLAASLPLINQRDHEHFDDADTPNPTFTRQDGSSGFGDVRFGGRYAFLVKSKDLLVGGATIKIPTGQYKQHDSEGNINEPTIQPGSGSYDGIASLYYAHQWIPMRFEYFVSASQKLNGENDLKYRFGEETLLSTGVSYSVGDRFRWSVQVNGRKTGRDQFQGENVSSTGSKLVTFTPGIRLNTTTTSSFYAFVQVPIYEYVNEQNLAPRTALFIGVSKTY